MVNFSIDKTTLLAIIIPMVALLLVGYISYKIAIQFIQKDVVDDRLLMDKIQANTLDIQKQQNSMIALDIRQSEAYAQALTQTIIIATLVAAGLTSVSVFVFNHGINKRHLAVERLLQIEVEKRTEQLQIANKQLLAANEQLELHDRMQQDFINIAAHELRTPIQPILGLAELLRRRIRGSAVGGTNNSTNKDIEHLDIIIRNAKRLLRLEQNMLDLTKIEDRSLKLDKEQFDLIENIQHLINDFSNELSKEKIELVFTQPTEKEAILVNADKVRISEVISNLLGNAIKFTTKGVGRNITIKVEKKNSEANVSIKDSGSGINPEIKPKLFSKFATNSPGGTGIGLFICKSIVEAHGGSIWAENNSDAKGATFTFSLPTTEQIVYR